MSTDESSELEQQAPVASPGRLLVAAREERNLSQKEVADQLHITVHYVSSIEQDAFEKLPGTVFAKGYIKRYAEILELDEDKVLAEFDAHQQDQQHQRNEVTRIHARKHRARNRNFAIASVILFTGFFAGLWGWNMLSMEETVTTESSIGAESTGSSESSAVEQTASATANEPVVQARPAPQVPAVVRPIDAAAANAAASVTPPPDLTSAEAEQTPVEAAINESISALSEQDETADVTVISVSGEGEDVLRVSFDDESFIQVSDRDSNRIYRGTLGSGEVLEITANAPFNVLLGDAPLTHMTLNGAEIDVSDSIRIDNSARLTVGL
ncbi:MAG: DUF4115 domain-containing protein [Gammaproteobacteria bacterium]